MILASAIRYNSNNVPNIKSSPKLQILGITCDNASNNDAMIEELAARLEAFPGAANQVRCFLHIVNLVAKGVLRQFEPPKSKKQGQDIFEDGAAELAAMSVDVEESGEVLEEDLEAGVEDDVDDDVEDDDVEDDVEGLEETREGMSPDEVKKLEEEVKPVRLVLAKVSPLRFCL